MSDEFNNKRFRDLSWKEHSRGYLTMRRISKDHKRIVVKVAPAHILSLRAGGYALILDKHHVVFLKEWCVSISFYGIEVLLEEDFWNVKEWGQHTNFPVNDEALKFSFWVEVAELQDKWRLEGGKKQNPVRWKRHIKKFNT